MLAVLSGSGVEVSLAALQALETLGDGRAVKAVMAVAASDGADRELRKAAGITLGAMNGPGVDKELVGQMRAADVKAQAATISWLPPPARAGPWSASW